MATYKEAGVDIDSGDECSSIAYKAAQSTFSSREGMIGKPVILEGGYSGLLDFGDFYLVQNDDGVGTKIEIALKLNKLDTLGYDLVAMVADDAICMGAETVSLTNTVDTNKVSKAEIEPMMAGLAKACQEQKIVVAGGEIAELGSTVNSTIWNATAVGIVEKDKVLTGDKIAAGDTIIGLNSRGFRSNGFTLIRYILEQNFGKEWMTTPFQKGQSWGEATLTPCLIYQRALLEIMGGYKEERKLSVKGVAHITGGGITNINRLLKQNNLGAEVNNIMDPLPVMQELQNIGKVEDREAYRTWNMGLGMVLITDQPDEVLKGLEEAGLMAKLIGEVSATPGIRLTSRGVMERGKLLEF